MLMSSERRTGLRDLLSRPKDRPVPSGRRRRKALPVVTFEKRWPCLEKA